MEKQLYMRWREDERRESPRADFAGEVSFECAGLEYILTARDLSTGGIGTVPAPGLTAPLEGSITFRPAPEDLPVACRCRVVYSSDGAGVGIEFLSLSDESRLVLKNFVDEAN